MSAGKSAFEVARRQREEAERLQRSAAKWEQGAEGEVAVARALEALPEGWIVLHDLPWPGRQRANLDHVVVGPAGVFVVDAKNWTGRIEVRDQVPTQNGRRREQAVSSATDAAMALQPIVGPAPCAGVLCFVRDEPLTASSWNVTICSTGTLVETLTSRPAVLGPEDVARCTEAVKVGTVRQIPVTATTAPPQRRRGSQKSGRVPALVGGVLLLVALATGGYQVVTDWAARRLTEVIVDDAPTQPAPKPAKRERQQQERKSQQQKPRG